MSSAIASIIFPSLGSWTLALSPELSPGPLGPFFTFSVDRFHSVPARVLFTAGAIPRGFRSTYNFASPEDRLGSDSHACGY
ncbi:unnamed protein product [Protopolystoma xenopodis]|uniref:Secreted protein n=1 Tax=Protopolystoma xenopodis TaxID=117903 RepID=A0A448WSD6_9PLAT|nr:unnamed protein product [Protopolystoma xenopodis]